MSKKTFAVLFLLMVSPVIIYFLMPSDENRIKKLIREEVSAIEKKDVVAFMSGISFGYRDEHGLSYIVIRKQLENLLPRYSRINVSYSNLIIDITDDKASARMDFLVLASKGETRGYYIGDMEEPAHLELTLLKISPGKWEITGTKGIKPFY